MKPAEVKRILETPLCDLNGCESRATIRLQSLGKSESTVDCCWDHFAALALRSAKQWVGCELVIMTKDGLRVA